MLCGDRLCLLFFLGGNIALTPPTFRTSKYKKGLNAESKMAKKAKNKQMKARKFASPENSTSLKVKQVRGGGGVRGGEGWEEEEASG